MTSHALLFRFGDAESEWRYGVDAGVPSVGDLFRHGACDWQVVNVDADEAGHTVVTLVPLAGEEIAAVEPVPEPA